MSHVNVKSWIQYDRTKEKTQSWDTRACKHTFRQLDLFLSVINKFWCNHKIIMHLFNKFTIIIIMIIIFHQLIVLLDASCHT